MPNKPERVILDTNLWISFLITKKYTDLDTLISNQSIVILFSDELLEEFIAVTQRPKLKKYFNDDELIKILELIDSFAEIVKVKSQVTLRRDNKDDFLLNLAIDGKADYLLTGDKDLLELKKVKNTQIVTITKYLSGKNVV